MQDAPPVSQHHRFQVAMEKQHTHTLSLSSLCLCQYRDTYTGYKQTHTMEVSLSILLQLLLLLLSDIPQRDYWNQSHQRVSFKVDNRWGIFFFAFCYVRGGPSYLTTWIVNKTSPSCSSTKYFFHTRGILFSLSILVDLHIFFSGFCSSSFFSSFFFLIPTDRPTDGANGCSSARQISWAASPAHHSLSPTENARHCAHSHTSFFLFHFSNQRENRVAVLTRTMYHFFSTSSEREKREKCMRSCCYQLKKNLNQKKNRGLDLDYKL